MSFSPAIVTQVRHSREGGNPFGRPILRQRFNMKIPCVYILANKPFGTLYIGVTSDLPARVGVHKQHLLEGFTKRYGVHRLVYYEMHQTMEAAIKREKQLKKWRRAWKIRLIEGVNPEWNDLFDELWGAIKEWPTYAGRLAGEPVDPRNESGFPPSRE